MLLRLTRFSLALLTCSLKLNIPSKMKPSNLTLEVTGNSELLIMFGSSLASFFQFVNTVAPDFSVADLCLLDSNNQS